MATNVLETLDINELYKRKQHLLLQLILVEKEIKKKQNDPNRLDIDVSPDKSLDNLNICKKITIRIKK